MDCMSSLLSLYCLHNGWERTVCPVVSSIPTSPTSERILCSEVKRRSYFLGARLCSLARRSKDGLRYFWAQCQKKMWGSAYAYSWTDNADGGGLRIYIKIFLTQNLGCKQPLRGPPDGVSYALLNCITLIPALSTSTRLFPYHCNVHWFWTTGLWLPVVCRQLCGL